MDPTFQVQYLDIKLNIYNLFIWETRIKRWSKKSLGFTQQMTSRQSVTRLS